MAEAAEACGLSTIIGSELSIGVPEPQNGVADPVGSHLLVLANGPEGIDVWLRLSPMLIWSREVARAVRCTILTI